MTAQEISQRTAKAEQYFMQGYNCAQAVVAAYADRYGLTETQALQMSAGFGGGIGRMRLTCGAACGMVLLEGLQSGSTGINDREGKSANYHHVQQLLDAFKQQFGTITCAELLKLQERLKKPTSRLS